MKKDSKYISKIEAHLKRLEARFAEGAPDAYAIFKSEERRTPGEGTRHQPSRSRKLDLTSDLLSLTVPANAVLLADEMGVGGYLGIISI